MATEFQVRKAQPGDALQLSVLFKQVYIHTYATEGVTLEFARFIDRQFSPERLLQLIEEGTDVLWVAFFQNNPVGVLEIQWNKACPLNDIIAPEINKLYILEHFCGKGVGQMLLEKAEEVIRAKHHQAWLWVYLPNRRAIRFYEKMGYQNIGHAFFQMEENRYENKVMLKVFKN